MKKLIIGLMGMMGFVAMGASFSYQGVLRDEKGGKVSEVNQSITFRLYEGPTTEKALWGRTVAVHLDGDGLFNVELGDSSGSAAKGKEGEELTETLDNILSTYGNATLYIGLEVVGSVGEIRPRQKLLAVPVASFAQDVSLAKKDFTVTGRAVVNGALTVKGNVEMTGTNKVQTLSVGKSATFAGETKVTGSLNITGDKVMMAAGTSFEIGGVSAVIPSGVIVMWSGSVNNIPSGWLLCDGKNGTPNLQNRFIVGAGNEYEVGDTGGKDYVQLSVLELPSHSHTVTMYGGDLVASWSKSDNFFTTYDKYSSYKHNVTTSAVGNNVAHENRPPFYALCFIMKK